MCPNIGSKNPFQNIDGVLCRDDFLCQEQTKAPHREIMNITA